MSSWLRLIPAVALAGLLAGCSMTVTGSVDLLKAKTIRIDGPSVDSGAGSALAGLKDINGDGRPDILVGAPRADSVTQSNAGKAFVVFTPADRTAIALRGLVDERRGVEITGAGANDHLGASVAAVGDLNGDGVQDVAVGAPDADVRGRTDAGAVYVVFSPRQTSSVDIGGSGSWGYPILGERTGGHAGFAVAGIGDVNRDGLPDLALSAPQAGDGGTVYVVFGKRDGQPVDLKQLGTQGYKLTGTGGELAGSALVAAGDLNHDGTPDLVIGAPNAAPDGRTAAGTVYVSFLRREETPVEPIASVPGIRINGAAPLDAAGAAVSLVPARADQRARLVIGAPGSGVNGAQASGSTYLVKLDPAQSVVELSADESFLYRVDGTARSDQSGWAVLGWEDEGRLDLVVGAPTAGQGDNGAAYVVPLGRDYITTDIAQVTGVRTIAGSLSFDQAGTTLATMGDLDGDGRQELLVGAPNAINNEIPLSGSAYVVLSRSVAR